MTQQRKASLRRTPEQRLAYHTLKAQAAKAKLAESTRQADTRRKIVLGGALIGLADAGDPRAMSLLELIKSKLTRPQDRAAFGLAVMTMPTEAELAAAITSASAAHMTATKAGASTAAELQVWREAVANWERHTGRWWTRKTSPEERQAMGLGGIGEVLGDSRGFAPPP